MKVGPIDVQQFAAGTVIVLLVLAFALAFGMWLGHLLADIAKQEDEIRRLDR